MIKKTMLGLALTCIGLFALTALLYQPLIKPWHTRWGATEAEVRQLLPGDEVVLDPASASTRAIDILAPASQVWPWLVQMGQGRGGLYSYDFLENLVGCDIHTLDQIVPGLQDLKVGDVIKIGKFAALPYYQVIRIDPGQALVLQVVDPKTGLLGTSTWGFYLQEKSQMRTRLIIRHRDQASPDSTSRVINAIFEPISFVMEHRMLYGIRERAEKLNN
jgi:hypothetical protein